MKKLVAICAIIFLSIPLYSQTQEEEEQSIELLDKIFQINKPPIETNLGFPILSLGAGILNFHGDVTDNTPANFSVGTTGVQFELLEPISDNYSIGFRFLRGNLIENTTTINSTNAFNFKTQITSFGTFATYNFGNNTKLPPLSQRILSPYFSFGIEVLQRAEAWGDLYTDSLKTYQWSDGTTRSQAESKYNASSSYIVYRDYSYESSYQQENIDNIAYFNPLTLSFPLEFGLQYNIHPNVSLKMGYQYHITLSNSIDNISQKGTNYNENPARKSKSTLPDGFSYAYTSLNVNIGAKQAKMFKTDSIHPSSLLEFWDADNDGIDETEDACPYTPKGVTVFANGCPLDDDKDKSPNYFDKENNTRAFYSNAEGVGMSEKELLARMNDVKVVEQREIYRFYPKLLNGGTVYKQFYKKIPNKFKILDVDKNEYIDIDEMLNAIDTFFDEGPEAGIGANLAGKDLYELIEFFFLQ